MAWYCCYCYNYCYQVLLLLHSNTFSASPTFTPHSLSAGPDAGACRERVAACCLFCIFNDLSSLRVLLIPKRLIAPCHHIYFSIPIGSRRRRWCPSSLSPCHDAVAASSLSLCLGLFSVFSLHLSRHFSRSFSRWLSRPSPFFSLLLSLIYFSSSAQMLILV